MSGKATTSKFFLASSPAPPDDDDYYDYDHPTSPSRRTSTSSSSSFDTSTLPYPKALPRSDFLSPDFSPSPYLSSLGHRHQTLEDLRSELRARSQLLSQELLDLVNAHCGDLLGLGGSLRGGEERIEELRVGLMGFRREVREVEETLKQRETKVASLVEEKRAVRREVERGRRMLELEVRVAELEARLGVGGGRSAEDEPDKEDSSDDDDDDDEHGQDEGEEDEGENNPVSRLASRVHAYRFIAHLRGSIGAQHPFVVAQTARLMQLRNTLLLDLGAALKQVHGGGGVEGGGEGQSGTGDGGAQDREMKVLALYGALDAEREALAALKGLR